MLEKDAQSLLKKYVTGIASNEEKALLEAWYIDHGLAGLPEMSEALMYEQAYSTRNILIKHSQNTRSIWLRIAAAASILLFLSIGTYYILQISKSSTQQVVQNQHNDIGPGGSSATLTLSNGRKITLSSKPNGQIILQGNISVTKSANGELLYKPVSQSNADAGVNTLTTKRKEQYRVALSDGTNVWLNAASSITYPAKFIGKNRTVKVTGEAYFEVAHNPAKPFRVITNNQTVEVLGTHFNINAYTDEPNIKTTLLQGSVKVSANNTAVIIKPGQQAALDDGSFSVNEANTEEAVAWKNGYFRFNQEKIEPIMRKLSRWYGIDVRFDGPVSDDEFSGTISRFKNISEVLKALEYYNTVHFKVEGRRVIVLK